MTLDLTKYIELKERGFTAREVLAIAQEDGLDVLKVILQVFNLSLREAKEIFMTTKSNERHFVFHEQLMDDLDKMNEEINLENQGGIS
jgi:hypothetical protein